VAYTILYTDEGNHLVPSPPLHAREGPIQEGGYCARGKDRLGEEDACENMRGDRLVFGVLKSLGEV
jgi:hypothetical protein